MKTTFLLLAAVFSAAICSAQSLTPTVVGSTGASGTSASGNVDWTVGEIMTETFSGGNIITQGFHQPWNNLTTAISSIPGNSEFEVYPNPVADHLNIHFAGTGNSAYTMDLYDARGRIVFSGSSEDLSLAVIPMGELNAGIYFLNIYHSGSNTRESFTINKTK